MTAQLASHLTRALTLAQQQPYLARRQNWVNQLERHAMMQPDAPALRFVGNTMTWADLRRRVAALAGALSGRGVGFGDRVMILMLNRTEFVESVLAANMIGAIAVPLNFRLTPTEIAVLVEDCVAHVMLTEAALAPVAIGVRNIQPLLSVIVVAGGSSQDSVFGYEDLLNEAGDVHEPVDIPNDSPALIMYTWHHRPPEGRRADSREPHRSGDDRALHQWRQYQQRRRFRRRPAVPYRRNRQHADRAAARLAHGDLSAGRVRPGTAARRAGGREGHRHLSGSRAVAGGLYRTASTTT